MSMAAASGSLMAFSPVLAEVVVGWPRSVDEIEAWCSLRQESVAPRTVVQWAASPDGEAFVYVVDDAVAGYGELRSDDEEQEVELAHIIVDPERRNCSVGRHLVRALTERARMRHDLVVLRVRPGNHSALRCYLQSGYQRVAEPEEAAWNRGQPHDYIWMTATHETPSP